MSQLAVVAVGRDRPGIVAALSGVLLEHGLNLEDSEMTILRGHFAVVLIVSGSTDPDLERLRADLRAAGERVGLELVEARPVEEMAPPGPPEATHTVTVYGVDHPGIVHAVASALAERAVNIADLTTRVIPGEGGQPVYVMILEVAIPPGVQLEAALEEVGRAQGVEVSLRELEGDAL